MYHYDSLSVASTTMNKFDAFRPSLLRTVNSGEVGLSGLGNPIRVGRKSHLDVEEFSISDEIDRDEVSPAKKSELSGSDLSEVYCIVKKENRVEFG